ncbi:MAG: 4-alpha-glucanotransferase [Candidatus Delongbacteria bacterium]|nr:4-alpha-glucanotransferase [Candidatus Delongbacteria bacterium]MBN2833683.1 4-alpha-glucanotransferase [Candidatus Delongbacteria bacterium]
MKIKNNKHSGILLHITSLPGEKYCGSFSKEAYKFVDFLSDSGFKYWQILPLTIISEPEYSPYSSVSLFGINPLLISIGDELRPCHDNQIDYDKREDIVISHILEKYKSFNINVKEYVNFKNSSKYWLENFILHISEVSSFYKKLSKFANDELIIFSQFLAFTQWMNLKNYANSKGILIVGDIPIYCGLNSVEFKSEPQLFYIDEVGNADPVAGVPPDEFSETGQLWGNPIYDWDYHCETNFRWWNRRINYNLELYDYLRIDHFRALYNFWAIPKGCSALEGKWCLSKGKDFLKTLKKEVLARLIAEDLGAHDEGVEKLRVEFKIPGMSILQFGPYHRNQHDPDFTEYDRWIYTGTHDNATLRSWYDNLDFISKLFLKDRKYHSNPYLNQILRVFNSNAQTAIVPLQDLLYENESTRMNTPGTTIGNWKYRLSDCNHKILVDFLKNINLNTNRFFFFEINPKKT